MATSKSIDQLSAATLAEGLLFYVLKADAATAVDANLQSSIGDLIVFLSDYFPNIVCNFAGDAAPTVDDDETLGYSGLSLWLDTVAPAAYVCLDASTGAAVWQQLGGGSLADGSVTAAKLATDAVITAKILDGNVTAGKLASNAVTTAKVADAAITLAKMANLAQGYLIGRKTAGAGVPEAMTLSEVLDLVGSAAQGDILYRGASGWTRLPAGTSGHFLKTQGSGADPAWAAASGGGSAYLDKWDATATPGASDDGTGGYSVGSRWYWPAQRRLYTAHSVATGAAKWIETAIRHTTHRLLESTTACNSATYWLGHWPEDGYLIDLLVGQYTAPSSSPGTNDFDLNLGSVGTIISNLAVGGSLTSARTAGKTYTTKISAGDNVSLACTSSNGGEGLVATLLWVPGN